MASIAEILFEIPSDILEGLASGELKLFGGVVRKATGQIVCFLKQVGLSEKLSEISKSLNSIGNTLGKLEKTQTEILEQLAGVREMQALTAAGIAGVAFICVAGFTALGKQIGDVKEQINRLQSSVNDIRELVNIIHVENIIGRSQEYYRTYAAFCEGDYEEAWRHARNCRADIESYLMNMPVETILLDTMAPMFLMKMIGLSMQLQIEIACRLGRDTAQILDCGKRLFSCFQSRILEYRKTMFLTLPNSRTIAIQNMFRDKESYLGRLFSTGIPTSIDMIDGEMKFVECCKADTSIGRKFLDAEYGYLYIPYSSRN